MNNEKDPKKQNGKAGAPGTDEKRRRLLKGGAGAAPLIWSVTARPAWASQCTLSGQMSGNLSAPHEECGGEGCSPGYWKNHPSDWHALIQPHMTYAEAFGFAPGSGFFPYATLGEVIGLCGMNRRELARLDPGFINVPPSCTANSCENLVAALGFQSVAAMQNAATSVSYSYTVADLVDLVQDAFNTGDNTKIETYKNWLDYENNLGCPFGGSAACK